MKIKIPNAQVQFLLSGKQYSYPKYATQLLVLANQNAQGTRPKVVGQMSELIQEFEGNALEEWEKWYKEKHPDAIEKATDKVFAQIVRLKGALEKIDRNMVNQWVSELVIEKTFAGLKFQQVILQKIAEDLKVGYSLANPQEESQGIDGYINDKPISIKASTYKIEKQLREEIEVPIVYYEKKKNEIVIEFEPKDFI